MRKIIISVLLAGLVVAGYFGYQQILAQQEETTAVTEDSLSMDTGLDQVTAEGRIIPLQEAYLSAQTEGQVVKLLVSEGEKVIAGEALLQLDTTDEEIAVQQAEAGVRQAEANLETAQAGLLQAQLGLAGAQLAVRTAEAELALLLAGPTPAQIALSERYVGVAEAGLNQAVSHLNFVIEDASNAEIAAAQAEITAAQKAYDDAIKIYQPILQNENSDAEEQEQASLIISAALSRLTSAQAALEEILAGATNAERNAATGGVTMATNQRDAAVAQLDLLLAGARTEQIAIAQAALQQAQDAVMEAELSVTIAETAVTQAIAALTEAEAALSTAVHSLSERTLVTPDDGTVAAINIKEGEVAQAGVPIVTIARFSQWLVETTDLTELDVVDVSEGAAVNIAVDPFPGATLPGIVTDISSVSANILGDVTYRATVEVTDSGELPLRWGMTAVVTMETSNAVTSPAVTSWQPDPLSVLAEGQLVPNEFINLAFQTGGEVVEILVEEGEVVESGAPLIQLDTTAADLALSQAEAHVASAEAGLRAAENQLALAEAAVTTAETAVVVAQANLNLAQAEPLPEEIAAAEANLAAAEAAINKAAANRDDALDIVSAADIAEAEATLAAATADLLALQEQYDQILNTCFATLDGGEVCPLYGPVEEQARAQLEVATAWQTAAQEMVNFLKAGPTTGQQVMASSAVTLAIANRDAAQAQLDLLLEGSTAEQIEMAEVGVAQAELGVELAQARIVQAETAVAQAQAALEAAQANEAAAQAFIDRLTLFAPMAGTVARIDLNLGELVAPGNPVVTLVDESRWKVVTTDLSELDVPNVEAGNRVQISFDALPDVSVNGTIEKVATVPGQLQGDVVYTVTIFLDDISDLPLRWGMTTVIETE